MLLAMFFTLGVPCSPYHGILGSLFNRLVRAVESSGTMTSCQGHFFSFPMTHSPLYCTHYKKKKALSVGNLSLMKLISWCVVWLDMALSLSPNFTGLVSHVRRIPPPCMSKYSNGGCGES